jgi:hypothetical protein
MEITRCPNCGMPLESSNYYLRGMTMKCRHCNFSGLPINSAACIYDKMKIQKDEIDSFREELGPESVSSKLAIISLFSFIVSAGAAELQNFAFVSLAGFLMFSAFFAFMRLRKK